MLQPRLRASLSALESSKLLLFSSSILHSTHSSKTSSSLLPSLIFLRSAHHAAEGRANGPKARPGRRLGAKRSGEQYVIPGNIIFRQRGTKWFPGENCDIGRDHTIFATEKGYVKFYKDPKKHPKRQYIGVALNRDDVLPAAVNAPRKRRLGMVAVPLVEESDSLSAGGVPSNNVPAAAMKSGRVTRRHVTAGPNYQYRESNYEIGKVMEKSSAKISPYERGNRWLAWRKKTERIKKSAELMAQKAQKKNRKKKVKNVA